MITLIKEEWNPAAGAFKEDDRDQFQRPTDALSFFRQSLEDGFDVVLCRPTRIVIRQQVDEEEPGSREVYQGPRQEMRNLIRAAKKSLLN